MQQNDPVDHSVTMWIGELKEGSDEASQKLWERYFCQLIRVAAKRMGTAPKRVADEEDVVLSVFDSLCRGAAAGRFKQLNDRDDLWKLLTAIVGMKVVDQIRHQSAKKRGGKQVRGESVFAGSSGSRPLSSIDQFLGHEPTPEFLLSMEEQQTAMFQMLPDESQREVARLRFEGYTNEEIASRLDVSLRTVERKLKVIREIWMTCVQLPTDEMRP